MVREPRGNWIETFLRDGSVSGLCEYVRLEIDMVKSFMAGERRKNKIDAVTTRKGRSKGGQGEAVAARETI